MLARAYRPTSYIDWLRAGLGGHVNHVRGALDGVRQSGGVLDTAVDEAALPKYPAIQRGRLRIVAVDLLRQRVEDGEFVLTGERGYDLAPDEPGSSCDQNPLVHGQPFVPFSNIWRIFSRPGSFNASPGEGLTDADRGNSARMGVKGILLTMSRVLFDW